MSSSREFGFKVTSMTDSSTKFAANDVLYPASASYHNASVAPGAAKYPYFVYNNNIST